MSTTAAVPALSSPELTQGGNVEWTPVFNILIALPPGASREVPVPTGIDIDNFVTRLRSNLTTNQRTRDIKFSVSSKNDLVWVTRLTSREAKNLRCMVEVKPLPPDARQPVAAVSTTLHELLIAKLPNFSPDWTDAVKTAWFAAYEEIVRTLVSPVGRHTVIR